MDYKKPTVIKRLTTVLYHENDPFIVIDGVIDSSDHIEFKRVAGYEIYQISDNVYTLKRERDDFYDIENIIDDSDFFDDTPLFDNNFLSQSRDLSQLEGQDGNCVPLNRMELIELGSFQLSTFLLVFDPFFSAPSTRVVLLSNAMSGIWNGFYELHKSDYGEEKVGTLYAIHSQYKNENIIWDYIKTIEVQSGYVGIFDVIVRSNYKMDSDLNSCNLPHFASLFDDVGLISRCTGETFNVFVFRDCVKNNIVGVKIEFVDNSLRQENLL